MAEWCLPFCGACMGGMFEFEFLLQCFRHSRSCIKPGRVKCGAYPAKRRIPLLRVLADPSLFFIADDMLMLQILEHKAYYSELGIGDIGGIRGPARCTPDKPDSVCGGAYIN